MSIPDTKDDAITEALEEGPGRYAAYAMRLRTVLVSSSRYVAYSSDIGEAFRPLTKPSVIRAAYGISWAYLLGDVGYAGYKAHQQHQESVSGVEGVKNSVKELTDKVELRRRAAEGSIAVPPEGSLEKHAPSHGNVSHVGLIMARRAVFQGLASMALPAFTIHSIVRYSAPLFAKSASQRVRAAGPTVAGLAFVPALPFIFDHPVEHVVDRVFDVIEGQVLGIKEEGAAAVPVLDAKTKTE